MLPLEAAKYFTGLNNLIFADRHTVGKGGRGCFPHRWIKQPEGLSRKRELFAEI